MNNQTELRLHSDIMIDQIMWRQTLQHYRRMWLLGHMDDDGFKDRLRCMGFTDYEANAEITNTLTLYDSSKAQAVEVPYDPAKPLEVNWDALKSADATAAAQATNDPNQP